jgi:hypothetical protein
VGKPTAFMTVPLDRMSKELDAIHALYLEWGEGEGPLLLLIGIDAN